MTNNDTFFYFHSPVKTHFGAGSLKLLPDLLTNYDRIGVISGQTTLSKTGLCQFLEEQLSQKDIYFFTAIEPNPSIATIQKGSQFIRENSCQIIVAVGGGSALDAGKAISILATNQGTFYELQRLNSFPTPPIPLIAIPTTCGTGSEMNHYCIITDTEKKDKINLSGENSFPRHAILDPNLLKSLPEELILATAFDALTHALEGYVARRANHFTDHLAIECIRRISKVLASSKSPCSENSLSEFLYASSLAGIVILHTGTTLLHALGYYLTNNKGIHHGTANATLLPFYIKLLKNNNVEKYEKIASIFHKYSIRPNQLSDKLMTSFSLTDDLSFEELNSLVDYALCKPNTANSPFQVTKKNLLAVLTSPI